MRSLSLWILIHIMVSATLLAQPTLPDANTPSNQTSSKEKTGDSNSTAQERESNVNWNAVSAIAAIASMLVALAALVYAMRMRKRAVIMEQAGAARRGQLQGEQDFSYVKMRQQLDKESQKYTGLLRKQCGTIKLLGSAEIPNVEVSTLETFVSLRIASQYEGVDNRAPQDGVLDSDQALKVAFSAKRVVLILGDAGTGKTTLLKYYAMSCLTEERYKGLGFDVPPFPIFFSLRHLGKKDVTLEALPTHLAQHTSKHDTLSAECFKNWLGNPSTIVLLDGLDEICDIQQRRKVCHWIDEAVETFKHPRFIITSRRTGYRGTDKVQFACQPVELQVEDFSLEQQGEFLVRWFRHTSLGERNGQNSPDQVPRDESMTKAETILAHLQKPENRGILEMARVPLILQIVAILWKDREHLPKARSVLYSNALNYLLFDREDQKATASGNDSLRPKLEAEESLRVLRPVCLWMQEKKGSDETTKRDFHREAGKKLRSVAGGLNAEVYCQDLRDRTGLLMDQGDDHYVFCHKSFREYMAGIQLAGLCNRQSQRIDTVVEHFGNDWWEECLRFMIAEADEKLFDRFMQRLFKHPNMASPTDRQKALLRIVMSEAKEVSVDAMKTHLWDQDISDELKTCILRDCLRPLGRRHPHPHEEAFEAVDEFAARGSGIAVAVAREIIAEETGKIISMPAAGKSMLRNPLELSAEYIFIPGSERAYLCQATEKEEIVPDLDVAKYPVTNRRYRRFLGYLAGDEADLLELLAVNRFKDLLAKDKAIDAFLKSNKGEGHQGLGSQYDDHKDFKGEEQPVVGITWHAARAYCLWLTALERAAKGDKSAEYRLPTDAEWEWAASAGTRNYPWPGAKRDPTPKLANYDNNVGTTTPVGQFPEGVTPEGLMDMAGNVWEWMANPYEEGSSAVSLRGGSWAYDASWLRCSARLRPPPGEQGQLYWFSGGLLPVIRNRLILCYSVNLSL